MKSERINGPRYSVWRARGNLTVRQLEANRAGCSCYVEVHHNATTDPKVNYALAIVSSKHGDVSKAWAQDFTERLATAFGIKAARVSVGPPRGDYNIKLVTCPAILTEAGFVSNPEFAAWIRTGDGIDGEARCLVESITALVPGGLIGLSVGHGDRGKPDPGALVNEGELHDPAFDTEEEINRAVVDTVAEMLLRIPASDTEPSPPPSEPA